MRQCVELALILLLVALAQGVMDVAPRPRRRVAMSFIYWVVAFGAATTLLSEPDLAAVVVRVGIVLLLAYLLRWIIGDLVSGWRGPALFAAPRPADLAEAASAISALPEGQLLHVARRIAARYEGHLAFLALMSLELPEGAEEAALEKAWAEGCEAARARVARLIERSGAAGSEGRAPAADVIFVAQALCLYEADSVERALSGKEPSLGGRSARRRTAEQLAKSGKRRRDAVRFGLAGVLPTKEAPAGTEASLTAGAILWPATALNRSGFHRRARALAIGEGTLIGYGILALFMNWGSGLIFIGVAFLIHVQAVLCGGDFLRLAAQREAVERAGGKRT